MPKLPVLDAIVNHIKKSDIRCVINYVWNIESKSNNFCVPL